MIQRSFYLALASYLIGIITFYFTADLASALWFSLGGGMALLNFLVAAYIIQVGLSKIRQKSLLLLMIFGKSLVFIAMVALVLSFTKPLLLPFTLGIGLVIFGLILWAAIEGRKIIFGKLDDHG
jgi:ethanolamine transporter EutH